MVNEINTGNTVVHSARSQTFIQGLLCCKPLCKNPEKGTENSLEVKQENWQDLQWYVTAFGKKDQNANRCLMQPFASEQNVFEKVPPCILTL